MKDEMGWTYNMHFYKFQIGKLIDRMVTSVTFWQDQLAAVNNVVGSRLPLEMQTFFIW